MLTLKRASKHRSGGPWSDDDYDVFEGDQPIGRQPRRALVLDDHGARAACREQAMADFKAAWGA